VKLTYRESAILGFPRAYKPQSIWEDNRGHLNPTLTTSLGYGVRHFPRRRGETETLDALRWDPNCSDDGSWSLSMPQHTGHALNAVVVGGLCCPRTALTLIPKCRCQQARLPPGKGPSSQPPPLIEPFACRLQARGTAIDPAGHGETKLREGLCEKECSCEGVIRWTRLDLDE
jgi:hypothetical protein